MMKDLKQNWKPLEFEKPLYEIEQKLVELTAAARGGSLDVEGEIDRLRKKAKTLEKEIFRKLTPIQKVQLSRHINRPSTLDYVQKLFRNFWPIAGDRRYAEDPAIVAGIATLEWEESGSNGVRSQSVVVVGQQKGATTQENIYRNFGMPKPEGYRKVMRAMDLADQFGIPVVSFIDTPGAFPGVEAEARGQAEAIAASIARGARLQVPAIAVVIGEGGSGGALALGVADCVMMLENAIYSVISPEGCAAITWKDATKSDLAAAALKLTAADNLAQGLIDEIVPEPAGGAHRNPLQMMITLKTVLVKKVITLMAQPKTRRSNQKFEKFRSMGALGGSERSKTNLQ